MLFVLHAQGIGDLRWFETSTFLKITTCHALSLLKIILQSLLSSLYRPVFLCTPHRKKPSAGKGPLGWNMMEPASWNTRCDVSQLTGGEVLLGEVVVWRCPCQCPWDMEVWEAKPWPEDLKGLVPEDVVLVSRDGHGTPAWLGGDYDGDLNMFSFDKDLLDVVKATEDRIRQLPVEDLDQQDGTLKGNQFGKLSWPLLDCSCEWHRFTVHSFLQIFRRYSC